LKWNFRREQTLAVARWRQASQRVVRSDLVVSAQPVVGDLPHLADRVEQVGVEHLLAVGAVEALDERVLVGLAGLDEGMRPGNPS